MKKALLLVAHGSRRESANHEVAQLADRLRLMADKQYSIVSCAFLEFVEPSIPAGIDALIDAGAEKIVVLPYFLAAGRHILDDIPAQVARKQAEHSQVPIEIAPYLGASDAVPQLLLSLACSRLS